MAITSFSRSDLKEEIFDLAQSKAVATQEEWDDLADEVVETHIDLGQIDKDQDTEGSKEYLRSLWNEYKTQATDSGALLDPNEEEMP